VVRACDEPRHECIAVEVNVVAEHSGRANDERGLVRREIRIRSSEWREIDDPQQLRRGHGGTRGSQNHDRQ
jgi:hypothetical protein